MAQIAIVPNWRPSRERVMEFVTRPRRFKEVEAVGNNSYLVGLRTMGGTTIPEIHENADDEWQLLWLNGPGKVYLVMGGCMVDKKPLVKPGTLAVIDGEFRGSQIIKGRRTELLVDDQSIFVPRNTPHCLFADGTVDAVLLVIKS